MNQEQANDREGDDTVGYGKPPVHSRWKPGQSGNPRGRPKKTKDVEKLFQRELDATIRITEKGETRTITKREALIKGMVNDALRGNRHAQKVTLGFMQNTVELDGFVADPEDRRAFERFLEKMTGAEAGGDANEKGGGDG